MPTEILVDPIMDPANETSHEIGPVFAEDPKTEEEISDEQEEIDKMEFYLILFGVMLFFFIMAGANERYKWACGHQTSFTIIFGVCVSLILYAAFGNKRADIYKFKQDLFFDFLLPPIILNSGFNMRRKKFF